MKKDLHFFVKSKHLQRYCEGIHTFWPKVLQLNTEGLTTDKISVIEQLAYKNKAFIIIMQETHCTTTDKLVIPNFSLPGSILSRNRCLAMFVHEQLEWSLTY